MQVALLNGTNVALNQLYAWMLHQQPTNYFKALFISVRLIISSEESDTDATVCCYFDDDVKIFDFIIFGFFSFPTEHDCEQDW